MLNAEGSSLSFIVYRSAFSAYRLSFPSPSRIPELHLDLADLDPVALAQALGLTLRHQRAIEQRAIGRTHIGNHVVIAVAGDDGVVARGDSAVVFGQIQLRVVILPRVA